ncbi:MAG: helix-turn-helix domain-containing protein [Ornithinibacter sp.]
MNSEQTAELELRSRVHSALGDPTRLRIVDLLATTDLSSAELGATLGVPSNLLAHHLGVLQDAGLLLRHRSEGDRRRTYLTLRTDALPRWPNPAVDTAARRLVFVCTANTARSHLAAALWRAASSVAATSAGTHPGERIHPGARAAARRHHLDLPDAPPRALHDSLDEGDIVITVCDRAHEEVGALAWAHWSIPDPVPTGTQAAFDSAHDTLHTRIADLSKRVAAVT